MSFLIRNRLAGLAIFAASLLEVCGGHLSLLFHPLPICCIVAILAAALVVSGGGDHLFETL